MNRKLAPPVALAVLPALLAMAPQAVRPQEVTAEAVLAEFDRLASRPLWPGFEPARVPLAIFDGERTVLVRHPSPPEGFAGHGEVRILRGRHPDLRANTSVDLGGVATATLLLDSGTGSTPAESAAVMIHETFHVFQRERHPAWQGNEGELFVYPFDDAGALALRRLETAAFRRALAATGEETAACWAARALEARRDRFARLPAGVAAYERGTELNEGLASFVEALSLGDTDGPELPQAGYPAERVRDRAYAVGHAQAALLERFAPDWRGRLENGAAASLDELLAASLAGRPVAACAFSAVESKAVRRAAQADADRVAAERRERRAAFLGSPGWKVEIAAGSQPLWPQGFDPLNVAVLGGGEVLHRRWLKLANERASLEVLDREALTQGAGAHPLFQGVRTLTLTGLAAEPKIRHEEGALVIEANGLTARLRGAVAEREEGWLKVRWPG